MAENKNPQTRAPSDDGAADDRSAADRPSRSLWRRPVTWIATVLTGAAALAITNQVVPLLESGIVRVAEHGPPIKAVSVEPLYGQGEFAFERTTDISEEFITQLNALGEISPVEWLVAQGATKVGSLTTRIVLEGTQSEAAVRILDLRPVADCGDPLDGSVFTYPRAGNEDAVRIEFDLDTPDAPGMYRAEDGTLQRPFFPDNTISLEKSEQMVLLVNVSTHHHYCEYRMALDVLVGEDRYTMLVPGQDDEPLSVTAPLEPSAYQAVFLGGVDCELRFRRATATFLEHGFEPACGQLPGSEEYATPWGSFGY